jgi:hypothetical protein
VPQDIVRDGFTLTVLYTIHWKTILRSRAPSSIAARDVSPERVYVQVRLFTRDDKKKTTEFLNVGENSGQCSWAALVGLGNDNC